MQGLRALGYVEGKNLILERRSGEGQFERFGDIVAEPVRLRTDAIVAPGDVAPRAAKTVTTTVPIVMATAENPVAAGKRLEIFGEALPGVSRVAYLGSKQEKDWEGPWGQSVRTAAKALGLTLVLAEFSGTPVLRRPLGGRTLERGPAGL